MISKEQKQVLKAQFTERMGRASGAIVAEYSGMSVEELTELRVELRKSESEFHVVKNRVAKKAIEDEAKGAEGIKDALTGPVGVVYMYGDVAASAKTVLKFAKDLESFKVTAGVMDGKAMSLDEIKAISDLPSKEVLLAKIVGSMVSPHRGILGVLSGVPRNLVQVINAIKDTKQ